MLFSSKRWRSVLRTKSANWVMSRCWPPAKPWGGLFSRLGVAECRTSTTPAHRARRQWHCPCKSRQCEVRRAAKLLSAQKVTALNAAFSTPETHRKELAKIYGILPATLYRIVGTLVNSIWSQMIEGSPALRHTSFVQTLSRQAPPKPIVIAIGIDCTHPYLVIDAHRITCVEIG